MSASVWIISVFLETVETEAYRLSGEPCLIQRNACPRKTGTAKPRGTLRLGFCHLGSGDLGRIRRRRAVLRHQRQ